jgi:hypothetical protein
LNRGGGGAPGPREERGTAAGSRRNPPHVTENDADAPVQDSIPAPDDVPVLPANAHGEDTVRSDALSEIDDESMYDRRPGEDKDRELDEMP